MSILSLLGNAPNTKTPIFDSYVKKASVKWLNTRQMKSRKEIF